MVLASFFVALIPLVIILGITMLIMYLLAMTAVRKGLIEAQEKMERQNNMRQ